MTRKFEGRNVMAADATLEVSPHRQDGTWLKLGIQHGAIGTPFFLRREDAPALALELLQLVGGETYQGSMNHLESIVQAEEDRAAALAARKQEQAARWEEERKLNDEASALFEVAYPGADWEDLPREVRNKFRRVAEAARTMYATDEAGTK